VDVAAGDDTLQEYDTFLSNEVLRHVGADWAGDIDIHTYCLSFLRRHAGIAAH